MFIPRRTREKARRTRRRLLFWNEAKERTRKRRHQSVIRPIVAMMSAGLLLAGCFAKIHELPAQPEHAEAVYYRSQRNTMNFTIPQLFIFAGLAGIFIGPEYAFLRRRSLGSPGGGSRSFWHGEPQRPGNRQLHVERVRRQSGHGLLCDQQTSEVRTSARRKRALSTVSGILFPL